MLAEREAMDLRHFIEIALNWWRWKKTKEEEEKTMLEKCVQVQCSYLTVCFTNVYGNKLNDFIE